MTASSPSLSTGTLASFGLSSNGANAAAATPAPRGQNADASSAESNDSFRKLLGQGGPAQNRNDAQAKDKAAAPASGNPSSQGTRPDDDAQARTSASTSAADAAATKADTKATKDDTDGGDKNGAAGSPDAAQTAWVAGLPTMLGAAIQPAAADNAAAQALPAGLRTATALAAQPAATGATPAVVADGIAAATPNVPVTALPQPQAAADASQAASGAAAATATAPTNVATTLAQSTAQAPSQTDTASVGKAASAVLAAIAPALVQPQQAGDTGKNADGIDLAALGLVSTGTQPAQATLQPATAVFPPTLPTADLEAGQFDQAIGARLTWMADQKIGHAHIKVSPEGMGQIEVQMKLDGSRVHADFNASQPEVRHALESSLPRLREMLDQQGFQLAQANVGNGQQQFSDARRSSAEGTGQEGASAQAGSAGNGSGAGSATVQLPAHGLGLLDAYA